MATLSHLYKAALIAALPSDLKSSLKSALIDLYLFQTATGLLTDSPDSLLISFLMVMRLAIIS
uniref:hypothetical protein n=1 Tax=Calothrix sp. NIES-2098 TaxID=1954171 RepID=UPI0030DD0374